MAWGEPLSDQWDRRHRQAEAYRAIRAASGGGYSGGGSSGDGGVFLGLSLLATLSSLVGVAIAVNTGLIPYRTAHRVARAVGLEHNLEVENGRLCPDASMLKKTRRQIQENIQANLSCIEGKTDACVRESTSDSERIDCLLGDIAKRRGLAEAVHPFTAIYAELPSSTRCYDATFDSFHDCSYLNNRGSGLNNLLPMQFVQDAENTWLIYHECPATRYPSNLHERDWEAYTGELTARCRSESVADWRRAARPLRQQYGEFKRQQEAMDQRPPAEQLMYGRGR